MDIGMKTGVYTFNGSEMPFSFYIYLNATKKIKFVNNVTECIVDENYNSIIRDLIFDFEIVNIFTDVDLTDIYESDDALTKIEEFLSETNIVKIVKENMIEGLLQDLDKAVDDNIAFRTGVHRNSLADSLSNLLDTLNRKMNEIDTEMMMAAAKKLNDMNGSLTPESVLKAYADLNLHKKKEPEKIYYKRRKQ